MKSIASLCLYLLLLMPLAANAELPAQLVADFAPLSGVIIMPIGDEFLVDLDATASLNEGDILTLVVPGEKVIHPVSKEVLGSLDIAKGFLQVTRIKSGYSYAKLLFSESSPQKGDQVRRYEQVPTVFVDKQGDGEQIQAALTTGLPQLDWLNEGSTTTPVLSFTLENRTLSAKTATGSLLHNYPLVNGQLTATPAPLKVLSTEVTESEPKILEKAVKSLIGTFIPKSSERDPGAAAGIIRQDQASRAGIWMGPSLQGHPVGIAVAELDGDGRLETAIALEKQLLIAQVTEGKYLQIASLDFPVGMQLLALDAADLNGDGRSELYLTATVNGEISSQIIEYTGSGYEIIADKIKWYLRSVELQNEGKVLLAQRQGGTSSAFNGRPFRVSRQDNQLIAGEEFKLPEQINLFSFMPFVDQEEKQLYAYLSETDYLKIATEEGEILWESGDYFGGSETRFDPPQGKQNDMNGPFYIGSRILKSPSGGIIVAQNEGIRTLQRYRNYQESRVLTLVWNGHSLDENWRTSAQNGYLGDFTLADFDNDGAAELVMMVKFKHKGFFNEARSAIVSYELQ